MVQWILIKRAVLMPFGTEIELNAQEFGVKSSLFNKIDRKQHFDDRDIRYSVRLVKFRVCN